MLVYFCRRGGRYYMMPLFGTQWMALLELGECQFLGLVDVSFWA